MMKYQIRVLEFSRVDENHVLFFRHPRGLLDTSVGRLKHLKTLPVSVHAADWVRAFFPVSRRYGEVQTVFC